MEGQGAIVLAVEGTKFLEHGIPLIHILLGDGDGRGIELERGERHWLGFELLPLVRWLVGQ